MSTTSLDYCPVYAPVVGALGLAAAMALASAGAAYGTAKSGLGIINVSITRPDLMMRSALPVIMAGILALYAVVVDAIIVFSMDRFSYPLFSGALHLGAGLIVGFSGLAAGIAIGIVGDAGVRGIAQQPRLYVGMMLILIFAEVLGIYGFFLGVIMANKASDKDKIKCSAKLYLEGFVPGKARRVRSMKERIPPGVPYFQLITENETRMTSPSSPSQRSPFMEEVFPCECRFSEEAKDPESQACGEHSNCINRTLSIECNPEDCPCRDNCRNQRFQKHQYADIEVFETPGKGFGLRTLQNLEAGQFIIEYVGEVLNQAQFENRAEKYIEQGQRHYYFMTLRNDQVIDATQKGNLSRFMNHSCNPNCATQKWIVRGRLRIGLFALKKIKAYTELTFDYKFIRFGAAAQKCLCGDSNCKGVIGEEQKDTRLISVKKPTSQQEEDDALLALERFKGDRGVEDADDLALLARLFLRMEDLDSIKLLLKTLSLTKDQSLLKRFVTLHGLQIINILIGIYWRDLDLVSEAVLILSSLPVQNRNAIEDANIEDRINRIGARDDLPPDIIERSRKLLENWSTLEHVYRIPKIVPDQKGSQAVPTSAIGGYSLLDGGDRFKRAKWSTAGLSASRSDQGQRHEYWRSPSSPAKESPTAWRKARAPDGRIYYYHEVTRETRWELPHEDKNGDQHWRDHNPRTNRPGDNRKIKDRDRRHDDQKLTPQDRIREPETIPHQARLHEIIERAKNAALTRNSSSEKSSTDADRSIKAKSSNPKDHGSQEWRSFEDLLRDAVSHVVVKYLSRWCRNQNLPPETFKDMARKLTHGIVDKELRHLRREMASPPTALTEDGLLSKSKRAKIKSYLSQYLRDHGYRVDDDSPAISGTTSSVSSLRDQ